MYRLSRNVEATVVDYLVAQLEEDDWSDIRVEKNFAEAYKETTPCLCVNVSERPAKRRETGSDVLEKTINIDVRVFANNDGLRLDLADWLLDVLIPGIDYYEYIDGELETRELKGRLNVLAITQNRRELRLTDNVVEEDRYRHILSLRCRVTTT